MDQRSAFLERVLQHMPASPPASYLFESWSTKGKPTSEGVGILPMTGAEPDAVIAAAMDVDHYVGNIDHVTVCRSIPDSRFERPAEVRFYQRIQIPVLGNIHHELVLRDIGTVNGYRIAYWEMLDSETESLSKNDGVRSQYSEGAWLAMPGVVAYALSSAPRRSDVGFIKWKALTAGADMGAKSVVRKNIEALTAWARRRR